MQSLFLVPRLVATSTSHSNFHIKFRILERSFSSYSRMLDMGGAPGASTSKNSARINNTSKNSPLQAVLFDFDALTRSVDQEMDTTQGVALGGAALEEKKLDRHATPNVGMVEQMANLLNVSLGTSNTSSAKQDDLSLLIGDHSKENNAPKPPKEKTTTDPRMSQDIRLKYAARLASKGQRSVSSIQALDNARDHLSQQNGGGGDAAGHLFARNIAMHSPAQKNKGAATQWMAGTGTGALLRYLTQRTIKVGLLPKPGQGSDEATNQFRRMDDLQHQLTDVVFDILSKEVIASEEEALISFCRDLLSEMDLADRPDRVLLVSDRDDYIRAAKELGITTCRIRPPKSRRGNVSAHYLVSSLPEVHNVVDEINGISFNAILKA